MKNNKKFGGVILSTIIKILVVLAIIFLLLWLFPTKQSLNPLYEQIFNENINSMKDAAESYFINARLPEEVGDSVTITLGEMLDKNLLLPFVDRYNKECDLTKSYVTITKTELDFEMKVNLVCSKESNYIIYHMGCNNKCAIFGNGTDKKEVTEYEFKKVTEKKVVDKYTCPSGYTLDGTKCTKTVSSTKKVSATPIYSEKSVSIDPIKTSKTIPASYSNWSNWSDDVEYLYGSVYKYNDGTSKTSYTNYKVPSDSDVLKVEKLTYSNGKEYEFRKSADIKADDQSKPIYTTALYKVGSYTQKYYTIKGYKYFIDTTTNTVYSYTGSSSVSYSTYVSSLPSNGNGNYYVVSGIDFNSCGSTCTLQPTYQITKYTGVQSVGSVSSFDKLRVEVDADEDVVEVPVYITRKTFVGYEQKVVGTVYNCYKKYHTKTRTKTEATTETVLSCKSGYTLQNDRCYSKSSEITGYTCAEGYTLKGKVCYKEVTSTETVKATVVYKTVNNVEYEWSTSKKLEGYTLTGKTRTSIVENENTNNSGTCSCSCN